MSEFEVGWQASPSQAKLDLVQQFAAGRSALDLGCGRGWYSSALIDRGFSVVGIDQVNRVDDNRIEVLERTIAAPFPFQDNAFDTVLMFDILEHLPHEQAVLQEVARVCRKRVLVTVPHADDGPLPRYGLTYRHHIDDTHLREYLPGELSDRFAAHGFQTLLCELKGQPTIPLVFSEFIRGGKAIRQLARYGITALYKIGLVTNEAIAGDIFYVGEKHVRL